LADKDTSSSGTAWNRDGVVVLSGICSIVRESLGSGMVERLLESGRARCNISDESRSSSEVDQIQSVIFQEIQVRIISSGDGANSLEWLVDNLVFADKEGNSSTTSGEFVDHLKLEIHVISSLASVINEDVEVKIWVHCIVVRTTEGRMTRIVIGNERRVSCSSRLVALKYIHIRGICSWKIRGSWRF